jgi:hypothetical protein
MTTGLEVPKLQIHISNATKGPNWMRPWQQLAPRRAKVNKRVAENAVLIINTTATWITTTGNHENVNLISYTGIVVLNGN